jgi:hypothetical protein
MKLNTRLIVTVLFGTIILSLILNLLTSKSASAATTTGSVTIAVNISISASITVTPAECVWNQVPSGGAEQTPCQLTVKNTGSVNLTDVYASVNSFAVEGARPYGSSASAYASGSFLTLRNSTGDRGYRFVNRLDWNETGPEVPSGFYAAGAVSWGYFRNHTKEYLWSLTFSSTNCTNTTGANVTIKSCTDSLCANRNMNSSNVVVASVLSNNLEWSVWNFSTGPLANYCVGVYKDCKKIMVYQWDINGSLPTCGNKEYAYQTTDVDRFTPDESFTLNLTVWVPRGIPSGDTTNSTLTITAEY